MIKLQVFFLGNGSFSEHDPRAPISEACLIVSHYHRYFKSISHLYLYPIMLMVQTVYELLFTLDVLRLVEILELFEKYLFRLLSAHVEVDHSLR